MREQPARATGVLTVLRVGLFAGLVPIAVFLVDSWSVNKIENQHGATRSAIVDQGDRIERDLAASDDRAALDRLCLIEALLAVRDALQGDDVPAGLPPACAAIVALTPTSSTSVP